MRSDPSLACRTASASIRPASPSVRDTCKGRHGPARAAAERPFRFEGNAQLSHRKRGAADDPQRSRLAGWVFLCLEAQAGSVVSAFLLSAVRRRHASASAPPRRRAASFLFVRCHPFHTWHRYTRREPLRRALPSCALWQALRVLTPYPRSGLCYTVPLLTYRWTIPSA
jgi:hypothetical protein